MTIIWINRESDQSEYQQTVNIEMYMSDGYNSVLSVYQLCEFSKNNITTFSSKLLVFP